MIYRFAGFELDGAKRELRAEGTVRFLQPQAFAVLEYLLRHRDRVVSKQELLEALWPDTVVGDGSLRKAIHAVRAVVGDSCIRTVARHGYRFVEPVEAQAPAAAARFLPRFVRSGEVHIAYSTLGEGALDIVLVPGWAFPMRAYLDHPELRAALDELTTLGRVVLFDKRGTGLSDRVKELPVLEQRMDDLRAVLDAVSSPEALLVGYSEGGPLCLLYASMYPERTRGVLLVGAFARWAAAPDYAPGWAPEVVARLREYIGRSWGAGDTIRAIAESRASDPEVVAWAARAEQEGASPGAALELLEMNLQIDVRPLLPSLSVPTAVLHHTGDAVIDVANSRYMAARIPGARLIECEGRDHVFLFEHRERLLEAIEWLLTQERSQVTERFLTTVLVAMVEGDCDEAEYDAIAARQRGVPGGRLTWSFDGPQRAIACGQQLCAAALDGLGIQIGIHTGEVGRGGAGLIGDGLEIAAAIARAAPPGEVWVSRVVRDLVHGSGLHFAERPAIALASGREIAVLASTSAR